MEPYIIQVQVVERYTKLQCNANHAIIFAKMTNYVDECKSSKRLQYCTVDEAFY